MWSNIELPAIKTKLPFNGRHDNPRTAHAQTRLFPPVTLTLIRWPWYTTMTQIFWRCNCTHCIPKTNFLDQEFHKFEHYRQTDRHTHRQMRLCKNTWYFGKMIWLLCEIRQTNKCSKLTITQHLHSSAEKSQCRLLCPGTATVSLSIAMTRFQDLWPFRFRHHNARAAGHCARDTSPAIAAYCKRCNFSFLLQNIITENAIL